MAFQKNLLLRDGGGALACIPSWFLDCGAKAARSIAGKERT
jgi:hypothetical protein